MMDTVSPKIAQFVAEARTELKRLGIDTEGKRSDELLNMAREQRETIPRDPNRGLDGDRDAGVRRLASAVCPTQEKVGSICDSASV